MPVCVFVFGADCFLDPFTGDALRFLVTLAAGGFTAGDGLLLAGFAGEGFLYFLGDSILFFCTLDWAAGDLSLRSLF